MNDEVSDAVFHSQNNLRKSLRDRTDKTVGLLASDLDTYYHAWCL